MPSHWSMTMLKVLPSRFQQCLFPSPCWSPKCPLKRHFLDIYLSMFFGVHNFKIHQLWVSSFFAKCLKFNVDFKNAKKNGDKVFYFSDNCIWIGCVKLCLSRREYLSRAVNALTNSFKTLHIIKRDFFQPNCFNSDQWLW